MAKLFDDKDEIKCARCYSRTFRKEPIFMYTKVSDRNGEAIKEENMGTFLICTECGAKHNGIGDLNKHRII